MELINLHTQTSELVFPPLVFHILPAFNLGSEFDSFIKTTVSVRVTVCSATAAAAVVANHRVFLQFFLQKPHKYDVPFYLQQMIFHHGDSFISFMRPRECVTGNICIIKYE